MNLLFKEPFPQDAQILRFILLEFSDPKNNGHIQGHYAKISTIHTSPYYAKYQQRMVS